jgi:hypothetical protein
MQDTVTQSLSITTSKLKIYRVTQNLRGSFGDFQLPKEFSFLENRLHTGFSLNDGLSGNTISETEDALIRWIQGIL